MSPLSQGLWTQTWQGGNLGQGEPTHKSCDTSIVWSRDKSKIFYLHFHKAQSDRLSRVVTKMRRPHPTCHVTPQSRRNVTTTE